MLDQRTSVQAQDACGPELVCAGAVASGSAGSSQRRPDGARWSLLDGAMVVVRKNMMKPVESDMADELQSMGMNS